MVAEAGLSASELHLAADTAWPRMGQFRPTGGKKAEGKGGKAGAGWRPEEGVTASWRLVCFPLKQARAFLRACAERATPRTTQRSRTTLNTVTPRPTRLQVSVVRLRVWRHYTYLDTLDRPGRRAPHGYLDTLHRWDRLYILGEIPESWVTGWAVSAFKL